MSKLHVGDVFLTIWKHTINDAMTKNPQMAITDIHLRVWQPTFNLCCKMLEQLYDLSIKLVDVDKYLKCCQGQQLELHITSLYRGVNACRKQVWKSQNIPWIRQVAHRINNYWGLCQYHEAASVLIELQSAMKLTGNFKNLKTISLKVYFAHNSYIQLYL